MEPLREFSDTGSPRLFIGGEWVAAADGGEFEVLDPATAQPLTVVASGCEADARAAVEAASSAAPGWAATSPQQRSEILRAGFESMTARADEIARLIVAEMGKAFSEARAEARVAGRARRFAMQAD